MSPRGHVVPFDAPSDEVVELRDQRRQLRKVCDEQRRELVRLDRELDRLRHELQHERHRNRRRWWQSR